MESLKSYQTNYDVFEVGESFSNGDDVIHIKCEAAKNMNDEKSLSVKSTNSTRSTKTREKTKLGTFLPYNGKRMMFVLKDYSYDENNNS